MSRSGVAFCIHCSRENGSSPNLYVAETQDQNQELQRKVEVQRSFLLLNQAGGTPGTVTQIETLNLGEGTTGALAALAREMVLALF